MTWDDIEIEKTKVGYTIYKFGDTQAYTGSFGNCQNFTVCGFEDLLYGECIEAVEDTNNFLYHISKDQGKGYVVIDIRKSVYERLQAAMHHPRFNVSFVVQTPYDNYNGTKMVLCILNLGKIELMT